MQWKLLGFEYEFKQTQGNSEGQGKLVCCSLWGSQKVEYNIVTEQKQQQSNFQGCLKFTVNIYEICMIMFGSI